MRRRTVTPAAPAKAAPAIQTADHSGRVTLGRGFANRLVIVREVDATEAVVTVARIVPERDAPEAGGGPAAGHGRPMGRLADAVAAALEARGRPMGWTELAKAVIAAGWPSGDQHPRLARAIQRVALSDRRLRVEGRTCALSGGRGGRAGAGRRRSGRRGWGQLGDAVAAVLGSAGRPMGVAEITRAVLAMGLCPDEGDGGGKLMKAIWHTVAWEFRRGEGGRFRRVPPGKCELNQSSAAAPAGAAGGAEQVVGQVSV